MAERNLSVDHVAIWRWVQRYAPVWNRRIRRELRLPNRSWRVDETYVKIAGRWRDGRVHVVAEAGPDRGETVVRRRTRAARHQRRWPPSLASAITDLKQTGELGRRRRCRTAPYLNNIIEQDHRFIKRITASLGFRSVEGACRTIEGYEAMDAIPKG